ncbi:DUF1566 domain-containing protein [uncultured Parabacteroides sp.]|jgi:hypothetical protein|uniref:Lcl domain-containing protein n=1 Tax=uncultured Parabacteroides sp. TaxID=512312 RepID=UPI0025EFFAE3|nr:DUF1566 domain-containing protein [uncultured Parabacteroides sp.]
MNHITVHRINRLFITAIIACLLPAAAALGQEMRKETLKGGSSGGGSVYAVFYSAGMPADAVWPIGMNLSRNKSTIRHTVEKGNGDNINVNDKVPFRFIIAPNDGNAERYWAAAMSFNTGTGGDNTNLNPNGSGPYAVGCLPYATTEFRDGWRLPTQRELMLMWVFRDAINTIYPAGQMTNTRSYWSATEKDATNAWLLEYNTTIPQFKSASKASSGIYYRCVRDY